MISLSFKKIDAARKLLGLSSEATLQEIKEAYREKVKNFHPDIITPQYLAFYQKVLKAE